MKSHSTRRRFIRTATSLAAGSMLMPKDCLAAETTSPNTTVPHRTLGKTGVRVPIIGVGADGIVTDTVNDEKMIGFLKEALDAKINFFDAAYVYGKDGQCEKNLGLLTRMKRRKEAFIATKTGSRSYDGAMRQIDISLKRLQTDYLDLVQMHHVCGRDDVPAFGKEDGVLTALHKLKDEKVVRFIGLTGHADDRQVQEALEMYEWDTFMCFVNPAAFSRPALEQQLPLARKKKVGVIAMKTFGGRPGPLVGEGEGRVTAKELLHFAWSHPIAIAIPGVTSRQQFRENLAAAREFRPLSDSEIKALKARVEAAQKPWRWPNR